MNIDLEDLLRQGIDRLPAEVPAGLTHRAARQARRHRLVTGAGAAAVVATLTAAAVAIGMLGFAPTASKRPSREVAQKPVRPAQKPVRPAPTQHPRPLPSWPPGPVTHATLVSRIEQAVLTSTNYIAYTRSYNHKNRTGLFLSLLDYRNMHLLINYGPHNHQAQLVTNYRNHETVKFVFYDTRKWALTTFPWSGIVRTDKNQCVGPADDSPQIGDPRWAAWLVSSLDPDHRQHAEGYRVPVRRPVSHARGRHYLPADRRLAARQIRLLRRDHVAAPDLDVAGPARVARAARILELPTHEMHLATANLSQRRSLTRLRAPSRPRRTLRD